MEKNLKMKPWQIITLAVLFIITAALIIVIHVNNNPDQTIETQPTEDATPMVSIEQLTDLDTGDSIAEPSASAEPTDRAEDSDSTNYTNGVTVRTDDEGNQTIDRDWGGSDESTKPSSSVTDTPDVTSPSPSASAGTESSPAPSASVDASASPNTSTESSPEPSPSSDVSPSPSESSTQSSSSGSSTPKTGTTKTEDGVTYTYFEGFGWIEGTQEDSQGTQMEGGGSSGEHIGSMG